MKTLRLPFTGFLEKSSNVTSPFTILPISTKKKKKTLLATHVHMVVGFGIEITYILSVIIIFECQHENINFISFFNIVQLLLNFILSICKIIRSRMTIFLMIKALNLWFPSTAFGSSSFWAFCKSLIHIVLFFRIVVTSCII